MNNFDPNIVLLDIATNIAVLLMTASVLQGHKYNKLNLMHICQSYRNETGQISLIVIIN